MKHLPPAGLPVETFATLMHRAGLATREQLRKVRREPAPDQKPASCYWSGYKFVELYDLAATIDMPPLTPARQHIWDRNRTCHTCRATQSTPYQVGAWGNRYCPTCQEPAAIARWWERRDFARIGARKWARDTLRDPTTVLIAIVLGHGETAIVAKFPDGAQLYDGEEEFTLSFSWINRADVTRVADRLASLQGHRLVCWEPHRYNSLLSRVQRDVTDIFALRDEAWSSQIGDDPDVIISDMGHPVRALTSLAGRGNNDFGDWYSSWVGNPPEWITTYRNMTGYQYDRVLPVLDVSDDDSITALDAARDQLRTMRTHLGEMLGKLPEVCPSCDTTLIEPERAGLGRVRGAAGMVCLECSFAWGDALDRNDPAGMMFRAGRYRAALSIGEDTP